MDLLSAVKKLNTNIEEIEQVVEDLSELLPKYPSPIQSFDMSNSDGKNIFQILSEKDIFLHHPYNSFDPVIRLLNEAAEDSNVLSIKITL